MTERHIPQSANRGVDLQPLDPPTEAIRKAGERNKDWDYTGEISKLYRRSETIIDRLYPVIHTPDFQGRLPSIVIGIGNLRNKNTLAAYNLVPDDYGLNYKITFNEQHYIKGKGEDGKETKIWRFGEWAQMETLVHEIGHHKQQMLGKDPFKAGKSKVTHNKEFTDMMEQLGIYCNDQGAHYAPVRMDSPAGKLFVEWGLRPPEGVPTGKGVEFDWFEWFAKDRGRERKGRSTLRKFQCPGCGANVRWGKKEDPMLLHIPCGEVLIDASNGDVYKAPKENAKD